MFVAGKNVQNEYGGTVFGPQLGGKKRKKRSTEIMPISSENKAKTCTIKDYPHSNLYAPTGALINKSPLICGGSVGGPVLKECYQYDKSKEEWVLLAKMKTARVLSASCPMLTGLFITGGQPDSGLDGMNNRYDSTEFIWPNGTVTAGPPLPEPRSQHCMVAVSTTQAIILGGRSRSHQEGQRSVIVFDVLTKTYKTSGVPLMNNFRPYLGCALIKKSPMHGNRPVVLAIGGNYRTSAEVYDFTQPNASWEDSKHLGFFLILFLVP